MSNAYLAVTALTIAANVAIGVADLRRAEFVLHNSARVGVAPSLLPLLAALKIAGAAGLIAGLLGVRPLGLAAAAGLVLFFVGAVASHVRARVYDNIAFPLSYLALAVATFVLDVLR
ncbi:DoxX family protein [Micromonospora sediminimaris]|uniref:DoxX family protein n=2 Tax=Micromonospora TaxID=1873 RepID=UPI00379AB156